MRIGLPPIWPRLKIAPQQHARKRQEHYCHRCAHQHCIKRHCDLPCPGLEAFIRGERCR